MPNEQIKARHRGVVNTRLEEIVVAVNRGLKGRNLADLRPVLARIGRGNALPHWYAELERNGALPNLDGKTIGSVVEMLFVAVLETRFLRATLRVNPARGVDLPDLDLGIKSPSENYCTSEPFYSAYERLLGGEFDIVVLLTDYQNAKLRPPLKLQIIGSKYLRKTQIADTTLCQIAREHREWLLRESEARTQKFFRFLAYVNQSDWLARQLLKLFRVLNRPNEIDTAIASSVLDFESTNARLNRSGKLPLPREAAEALTEIRSVTPRHLGVIDAADNWLLETWKEAGRSPNENEWQRLKSGPLDGAIGMSFALQWRYNFGRLFGATEVD